VNRRDAAPPNQFGRFAEERDRRPARPLVRHADVAPRDRVAEGFARRLLRGIKAG